MAAEICPSLTDPCSAGGEHLLARFLPHELTNGLTQSKLHGSFRPMLEFCLRNHARHPDRLDGEDGILSERVAARKTAPVVGRSRIAVRRLGALGRSGADTVSGF